MIEIILNFFKKMIIVLALYYIIRGLYLFFIAKLNKLK